MSAQQGAPALGRAQVATPTLWNAPQGSSIPRAPRPPRLTQRAMAVAGATLCAPLVAAVGLAAIGAAAGGNQAEMGTLAGTQGLRGSTVAETSPAPTQVSGSPADHVKTKADTTGGGTVAEPKRHPTQDTAAPPQREPAPSTRAPSHKQPTQTAPEPPKRVNLNPPAPTPPTTTDPSTPGAPTSSGSGSTGDVGSSGPGSGSEQTSNSGQGASGTSSTTPESRDGYPGGD